MQFEERLWLEKIFQEMAHIREQGRLTLEKVIKIMADVIVTQEQLDQVNAGIAKIGADLQGFDTDVTAIGDDVAQVLTLLQNAQATGTRVDLTTAIGLLTQADQNLGTLDTKVQNLNTTMGAVLNPQPPPAPAPVPVTTTEPVPTSSAPAPETPTNTTTTPTLPSQIKF